MGCFCFREFFQNFDGSDWGKFHAVFFISFYVTLFRFEGHNGPGTITRVLKTICHVDKPPQMAKDQCLGFKVYPPSAFYAVPWPDWHFFFDPDKLNKTLEMTKDSIVIHVWNKHSFKRKLKVGTKAAYGIIAERNCPKVYSSVGDLF